VSSEDYCIASLQKAPIGSLFRRVKKSKVLQKRAQDSIQNSSSSPKTITLDGKRNKRQRSIILNTN